MNRDIDDKVKEVEGHVAKLVPDPADAEPHTKSRVDEVDDEGHGGRFPDAEVDDDTEDHGGAKFK